jgi:hypothetical protein
MSWPAGSARRSRRSAEPPELGIAMQAADAAAMVKAPSGRWPRGLAAAMPTLVVVRELAPARVRSVAEMKTAQPAPIWRRSFQRHARRDRC